MDYAVVPIQHVGYDGSATGGGGYTDYGNRGAGDFNRGGDFGGGYSDRGQYGQSVGGAAMGYTSSAPMGGYGQPGGTVGGYGAPSTVDYGRTDYGRTADFGARTDYGSRGNDFPSTVYFNIYWELSTLIVKRLPVLNRTLPSNSVRLLCTRWWHGWRF